MSTQPIYSPASQQLQGFYPSRTPEDRQPTRSTNGTPAFTVTISSTQNQPIAQRESFWHQRGAALDQLGSALASGDAAATQQAYDALVALGQSGQLRNGQTFHRADRAQDFAAIGEALQSGDLAAAQAAFTALAGTFTRSSIRLLGPPAPAPAPASDSGGPVGPPTIAPPSASENGGPLGPPEIAINVGGSGSPISFGNSGSNSQVKIDLAQKNGREAISVNFSGGNNNYQLVLNLLQSNSSEATQKVSLQA